MLYQIHMKCFWMMFANAFIDGTIHLKNEEEWCLKNLHCWSRHLQKQRQEILKKVHFSHVEIFIILMKKNFQRYGIAQRRAFHLENLEVWPLLLWKFGLGSYSRSKIHWCLAARRTVNNTLTVTISGKQKVRKSFCFDPLNGEMRRQTPMDL